MSRYTRSDVIPWVAHGVFQGEDTTKLPESAQSVLFPEFDKTFASANGKDATVNGWACVNDWVWRDDAADCGKQRRLMGDEWTKDGHVIYVINESPYASVSVYSMAVCSDTREAVEAFVNDHNLSTTYFGIDELDSVEQTL